MITDFNKLSKESHSQKKEKKKVKIIKRNNEIIIREALETRAESDEESEEYDSDSTPGPGYYSYVNQEKKNFRSKNEKFKKIFINQSKRFLEKNSNQRIPDFIDTEEKLKKKNKFFISRIPRQFLMTKNDDVPPPGYYNTRQSMEHILVDKMLKNSSTGLFNNNLPRFLESYET